MNTDNQPQSGIKTGNWFKTSITARMLMVGFLTLVLLIPLWFVQSLIAERQYRQQDVVEEINKKWGQEVLVYGPILKVPYKTYKEKYVTNSDTKTRVTEIEENLKYAYFLPATLDIKSTVTPETKSLGMYEAAVHKSDINITGSFEALDWSSQEIAPEDILWEKAQLVLQTSNIKGVSDEMKLKINDGQYSFTTQFDKHHSSLSKNSLYTLETAALKAKDTPKESPVTFSMNLNFNGSQSIRFVPLGKVSDIEITSNWHTNHYNGDYLPQEIIDLENSGQKAIWKVLDINRPFPQEYFGFEPQLTEYAVGVDFLIPVDEYQKSDRASKYGFLVIGLTFLIFFLIQTLSKINIHLFQYLMIGLALIMFYTLLISISEHSSFLKAYLIAGISVVLLITLYSKSILKGWKFPLFITTSLSALYGFIYVIIQLENYALLVGSIGLFVILALVMFASRKIEWHN